MVNERLDKNFEKSNKTFNNVLERLSKIDEAQRKIDDLGADIISLQGVLTDKKTREERKECIEKSNEQRKHNHSRIRCMRHRRKATVGVAGVGPEPLCGIFFDDMQDPAPACRRNVRYFIVEGPQVACAPPLGPYHECRRRGEGKRDCMQNRHGRPHFPAPFPCAGHMPLHPMDIPLSERHMCVRFCRGGR